VGKNKQLTEKEIILQALMMEYQNIHQRVFNQIKQNDENNVKILTLMGILIFFGMQNYGATENSIDILINILFIFILPLISTITLLLAAAHMSKGLIFADYLKIIENKINTVLESEAKKFGFHRSSVLDWEYWRYKKGHMNKKTLLSDIAFTTVVLISVILIYLIISTFRLSYIYNTLSITFIYYFIGAILMLVGQIIVVTRVFVKLLKKRKEQMKTMKLKDIIY